MADSGYRGLLEEEQKNIIVTSNSQNLNQSAKHYSFAGAGAGPIASTAATDSESENDNEWDEDDYDVLNNIFDRNYTLLVFLTIFGTFVGSMIYVVSDNKNYIWICALIAFAIALFIDISMPDKRSKTYYKVSEPKLEQWAPPPKGCNFYVQCDFTDNKDKYAGSTAIYELDEPDGRSDGRSDGTLLETKTDIGFDKNLNENSSESDNEQGTLKNGSQMACGVDNNGLKIFNRNEMNGKNILNFFGGYDDSRILVFRQRSVFPLKLYKGYELGGGFGALIAFVTCCILAILDMIQQTADWWNWNFTIYNWFSISWFQFFDPFSWNITEFEAWCIFTAFVTIISLLIGSLLELSLRRNEYLAPLRVTYESTEWIAISEIIGWYYNNVGFDYNKDTQRTSAMNRCQKCAFGCFTAVTAVVVFIFKFIKQLIVKIVYNPACILFLIVTLAMVFVYWSYMDKTEEDPLIGCMICCILGIVGNSICLWYVSNNSHACCGTSNSSDICGIRANKVSNTRVNVESQNRFYILFLASLISLSLACLASVIMVIEIFSKKHSHLSLNSAHWKYITCKQTDLDTTVTTSTSTDSNMTDFQLGYSYTPSSEGVDLCTVYVYAEHVMLLVFLSLDWFILWVAAFGWYLSDSTMTIKRVTYRWKDYTLFTIKRKFVWDLDEFGGSGADSSKRGWSRLLPSLKSLKRMVGGSGVREYTFKLDLENSLKLHYYLARATKLYRRRHSILSNPWPTPIYNMPQCKKYPLHEPHHCPYVAKYGNEHLSENDGTGAIVTEKDKKMKKDD